MGPLDTADGMLMRLAAVDEKHREAAVHVVPRLPGCNFER